MSRPLEKSMTVACLSGGSRAKSASNCIQGYFVFKAHRLLYHSTLGSRVLKKKKKYLRLLGVPIGIPLVPKRLPARAGSGFRVQGAGFRVQDSGCRVQGAGFRVQGSGCTIQGKGGRVQTCTLLGR